MPTKQSTKKNNAVTREPSEMEVQKLHLDIQRLRLDESKAWFEFHKHMTTLNTGVIVIIATLVEKVFTNVTGQSFQWVAISFYAFLASITMSAIGLGYHMPSLRIVRAPSASKEPRKIYFSLKYVQAFLLVASLVGFLSGIFFFIAFSLSNALIK